MIQTLFGSLDEEKKPSFIERMKEAVTRTRENLAERIEEVVSFGKEIDRNTLDDLEATLIGADLAPRTTQEVLGKLRDKADRKQIKDVQELKRLLKEELLAILSATPTRPGRARRGHAGSDSGGRREWNWQDNNHRKAVAGISRPRQERCCCALRIRSARRRSSNSKSGGQRTGTEVIKTKPGGDPAAVLFDALQAAAAEIPIM